MTRNLHVTLILNGNLCSCPRAGSRGKQGKPRRTWLGKGGVSLRLPFPRGNGAANGSGLQKLDGSWWIRCTWTLNKWLLLVLNGVCSVCWQLGGEWVSVGALESLTQYPARLFLSHFSLKCVPGVLSWIVFVFTSLFVWIFPILMSFLWVFFISVKRVLQELINGSLFIALPVEAQQINESADLKQFGKRGWAGCTIDLGAGSWTGLCLLELINCSQSSHLFKLALVRGHVITSSLPFPGASKYLCAVSWIKEPI